MSAEELRQAAETLRATSRRTRETDDFPWTAVRDSDIADPDKQWVVWSPSDGWPVASEVTDVSAAYIATMHPGVGLALADWLDHSFRQLGGLEPSDSHPALAVARLINGGAS